MSMFSYKEFHFDFVGKKKIWYIIALLFIVPGLVLMAFSGLNLGLDFTGGSILEVTFDTDADLADVRAIVTENVSHNPAVNESDDNHFTIRTEELEEEDSQALVDALSALGEVTVQRSDRIGPVIGQELLRNAQLALLIAGALMLLYITIRFKFNYALTAIMALGHDILVLLSMFAILRVEVDSAFIAALLTTIGYSINNTIVVYDRIRENQTYKGRMEPAALVNNSINETLTRSINTTIAVLILLFALFILGGDTTKNFVLAMIIGLCAGFFSSCFLAGNLLLEVSKWIRMDLAGNRKRIQK
ncbi:MAG: protein translocase subunit SecF [Bacillota bacterium]|nr:protein translocase subunit SecF [Bacillota bacterium]